MVCALRYVSVKKENNLKSTPHVKTVNRYNEYAGLVALRNAILKIILALPMSDSGCLSDMDVEKSYAAVVRLNVILFPVVEVVYEVAIQSTHRFIRY